jgi:hypothetical protein
MIQWQVEDNAAFVPESGALSFRSVTFADSGEYHCVVNGKKEDGVVRFFVQGIDDCSLLAFQTYMYNVCTVCVTGLLLIY